MRTVKIIATIVVSLVIFLLIYVWLPKLKLPFTYETQPPCIEGELCLLVVRAPEPFFAYVWDKLIAGIVAGVFSVIFVYLTLKKINHSIKKR